MLSRRSLVAGIAATSVAGVMRGPTPALSAVEPSHIFFEGPFQPFLVEELARQLAKSPYRAPAGDLPATISDLTYDQYRDISFRPEAAIWANEQLPFRLHLFHRGFYYQPEIPIALVEEGMARRLAYSPGMQRRQIEVIQSPTESKLVRGTVHLLRSFVCQSLETELSPRGT